MRPTVVTCGFTVLSFYLLLWGAKALLPGSAASTVVLVLVTIASMTLIRPGWNIKPSRAVGYWAVLWSLLLGSAALAASVLTAFKIPTPYDTAALHVLTILPGIAAMTGMEELLFRQVLFRWLETHHVSGKRAVLATSVAFGGAHLGPLLTGGGLNGPFYLRQSLYMV
jgi:hypothetical protein